MPILALGLYIYDHVLVTNIFYRQNYAVNSAYLSVYSLFKLRPFVVVFSLASSQLSGIIVCPPPTAPPLYKLQSAFEN